MVCRLGLPWSIIIVSIFNWIILNLLLFGYILCFFAILKFYGVMCTLWDEDSESLFFFGFGLYVFLQQPNSDSRNSWFENLHHLHDHYKYHSEISFTGLVSTATNVIIIPLVKVFHIATPLSLYLITWVQLKFIPCWPKTLKIILCNSFWPSFCFLLSACVYFFP